MKKPVMKKRTSKLVGHPGDTMRSLMKMKSDLHSYFYWDSRLFRKIEDHVWHAEDCVLMDRPAGYELTISSASTSFRFIKAHTFGTQFKDNVPYEPDVFSLYFAAEFRNDEEDHTIEISHDILVPLNLEDEVPTDVFEARWAAWLEQQRVERDERRKKKELPTLEKLLARYPEEAKKLLKEKR
jgi:hypothetical protein